ncbi:class I SAM-dependent methyltransferase [Pedobacter sp. MC2016-14]|uniref:class I SAM-dependent methyltransferase n=1 Tax=Pedobacter sp. MC2016-14 TaxID=2897327 RepID=UPI001E49AADA|nr:methyltransferase domain-containing protein [Pedobacter sp. MC2016-14]MCD0487418.1 class I SAM-dependent methyltransferase [Pedobacter sp. MC2016-14]
MDVFGEALKDEFTNGGAETLWLHNSYGEPEEMPVDIFFRTETDMPDLEYKALEMCHGDILDVGAGAGSHALELQSQGFNVTALDLSPAAVMIMKQRGVKNVVEQDLNQYTGGNFDTILLLMNGIGITGTLQGLKAFLLKAKELIKPDGQLIFDSSDIAYLYQNTPKPLNKYYGEIAYQYQYKGQKGNWFNWLYIDEHSLISIAEECGWNCEIVMDDGQDQYLAHLTL